MLFFKSRCQCVYCLPAVRNLCVTYVLQNGQNQNIILLERPGANEKSQRNSKCFTRRLPFKKMCEGHLNLNVVLQALEMVPAVNLRKKKTIPNAVAILHKFF